MRYSIILITGFTLVADASHAAYTLDGVVYLAIGN